MIHGKKVVVVMPAYNAEKTLEATYNDVPKDTVDSIILVDDRSSDNTISEAKRLGLKHVIHPENRGYGGNQKTCYTMALREGADIVVMVHPDYQYAPTLITAMAGMIASGEYDAVLGSRMLGTGALKGGMPLYKFISNRFLTFAQNMLLRERFSEYHTGFRAFSRQVLMALPLLENSDDFIFDNQMLVQTVHMGFRIGEISCPTRYTAESSSINFRRSLTYGFGVLWTTFQLLLVRLGLARFPFLEKRGRTLAADVSAP